MFLVFITVKQVAGKDYFIWLKVLYLLHQPMQIFFINILWNGDTGFSEMTGLTKMQI